MQVVEIQWNGAGLVYVLEADSSGRADGLDVGGEWKKGTKGDFQIFDWTTWTDDGAIHWEH